MSSNRDRTVRYVDVCMGRERNNLAQRGTVFACGDTLYSYGFHFPMVEWIQPKRERPFFLLNGDRYSVTTSGHQSMVRQAIGAEDVPSITVPFEALRAAGIDRKTIRPIEVRADRADEWTEHVTDAPLDLASAILGDKRLRHGAPYIEGDDPGHNAIFQSVEWGNGITGTLCHYGFDNGGWHHHDPPKLLGPYKDESPLERVGDSWHVRRYRHWLGDAVFTAEVRGKRRSFISSFDYNERRPLYFLAELPRNRRPVSMDDALDMLAPAAVHAALAQGREVRRQGDIFAIPTALSNKDVRDRATIRKRGQIHGTEHTCSEVAYGPKGVTYGKGTMRHETARWGGPDHARIRLGDGKTWHLLIRNTVPRQAGTRSGSARRI